MVFCIPIYDFFSLFNIMGNCSPMLETTLYLKTSENINRKKMQHYEWHKTFISNTN